MASELRELLPHRALAAAVVVQALHDAARGTQGAVTWFERSEWAEGLCHLAFAGGRLDIETLRRFATGLHRRATARRATQGEETAPE